MRRLLFHIIEFTQHNHNPMKELLNRILGKNANKRDSTEKSEDSKNKLNNLVVKAINEVQYNKVRGS